LHTCKHARAHAHNGMWNCKGIANCLLAPTSPLHYFLGFFDCKVPGSNIILQCYSTGLQGPAVHFPLKIECTQHSTYQKARFQQKPLDAYSILPPTCLGRLPFLIVLFIPLDTETSTCNKKTYLSVKSETNSSYNTPKRLMLTTQLLSIILASISCMQRWIVLSQFSLYVPEAATKAIVYRFWRSCIGPADGSPWACAHAQYKQALNLLLIAGENYVL